MSSSKCNNTFSVLSHYIQFYMTDTTTYLNNQVKDNIWLESVTFCPGEPETWL